MHEKPKKNYAIFPRVCIKSAIKIKWRRVNHLFLCANCVAVEMCCRWNLLPYIFFCKTPQIFFCPGKFFTKMKKKLTCSALGQRQLSWWVVAISLLCTVPLPVASVPVAISVDAVGHKLYPSGLIAIQNNNNKFRKKITIVSKYKVCAQAAHKSI